MSWDFDNPDFLSVFAAVMGAFMAVFIIFMVFGLVFYILRSIGLYTLAKNRGMSGAGLAWIPVFGVYRIGSIADDIAEKNGSKTYYRYFLIGLMVLSWILPSASVASAAVNENDSFAALAGLSSISWLLPIATIVITVISLNTIYKCYRPQNSTLWTVLSVIFSFPQAIFLFMIRNDMPAWGMPPQSGYYPPQGAPYWPPPQDAGYYAPPQAPNPPEWNDAPPSGE